MNYLQVGGEAVEHVEGGEEDPPGPEDVGELVRQLLGRGSGQEQEPVKNGNMVII